PSVTNNDIIVEINDDDAQDLFDNDISDEEKEEEEENEQAYMPINIDLDEFATENLLREEYNEMKNSINKEEKNDRTEVKSTIVKKAKIEEISDYLKLEKIDIDCDPF
ncbi:3885_t:CDS:2, partial [Racocetra fulgida]